MGITINEVAKIILRKTDYKEPIKNQVDTFYMNENSEFILAKSELDRSCIPIPEITIGDKLIVIRNLEGHLRGLKMYRNKEFLAGFNEAEKSDKVPEDLRKCFKCKRKRHMVDGFYLYQVIILGPRVGGSLITRIYCQDCLLELFPDIIIDEACGPRNDA